MVRKQLNSICMFFFYFLFFSFFFFCYSPNAIFCLLYIMVTQLHIHVHILFSHIIMLHHKWLDIVPRATQQELTANPFQRQQFASIVLVVTREGVTNNTCISPNRLVYGRYLLTGSFFPHFIFYFILFIYLFILGLYLWHVEVPRLGVKSEL